jgi:hypothetical protein
MEQSDTHHDMMKESVGWARDMGRYGMLDMTAVSFCH